MSNFLQQRFVIEDEERTPREHVHWRSQISLKLSTVLRTFEVRLGSDLGLEVQMIAIYCAEWMQSRATRKGGQAIRVMLWKAIPKMLRTVYI